MEVKRQIQRRLLAVASLARRGRATQQTLNLGLFEVRKRWDGLGKTGGR